MPEVIEQLNNGAAWWIAIGTAILSLIQLAPIKVNPWSFIATKKYSIDSIETIVF